MISDQQYSSMNHFARGINCSTEWVYNKLMLELYFPQDSRHDDNSYGKSSPFSVHHRQCTCGEYCVHRMSEDELPYPSDRDENSWSLSLTPSAAAQDLLLEVNRSINRHRRRYTLQAYQKHCTHCDLLGNVPLSLNRQVKVVMLMLADSDGYGSLSAEHNKIPLTVTIDGIDLHIFGAIYYINHHFVSRFIFNKRLYNHDGMTEVPQVVPETVAKEEFFVYKTSEDKTCSAIFYTTFQI